LKLNSWSTFPTFFEVRCVPVILYFFWPRENEYMYTTFRSSPYSPDVILVLPIW
jgi:hypothetical protein